MKEVFLKLQKLQDILSSKYLLEKELELIPMELEMKEELLNHQKKNFIELNAQGHQVQRDLLRLQSDLNEYESECQKAEHRMDEIKTQREYEALDKEIGKFSLQIHETRRFIQNLESKKIELSEKLESEGSAITLREGEIEEERKHIQQKLEAKKHDIDSLREQEQKISPEMEEDMLFKLDRILRSKSGRGIVPVSQSVCSGCFMILPRQFINDVRSSDKVHFCPYCSRILFYDEEAADGDKVGTGVLDFDTNYQNDIEGLTDLIDESDFGDFE